MDKLLTAKEAYQATYNNNYFIEKIIISIKAAISQGRFECRVEFNENIPYHVIDTLRCMGYTCNYVTFEHYLHHTTTTDESKIEISWN